MTPQILCTLFYSKNFFTSTCRKSKRSWIRLFFKFFDYAIHNAYLLYKHNCRNFGVKRRSMKKFRMELVHLLAKDTRRRVRKRPFSSVSDDHEGPCSLERVAKIGLARGRCKYCTLIKRDPIRSTSFGCDSCLVRHRGSPSKNK